MSHARRRVLALAAIAAVFGAGLGLLAGQLGMGSELGLALAILAGFALAAVLMTTNWEPSARVHGADESAWTDFRRELRRARRHERPLTLIRVPDTGPSDLEDSHDLAAMSRQIGARLRLIDRTWVDDGSVYVMLPESSRAAAYGAVQRMAAVISSEALAGVRIASFPEDGLTSGAILAAVHDATAGQVPIPMRPAVDETVVFALEDDLPLGEIAIQR